MASNKIVVDNARFTVLDDGLVRMEYSDTGEFENRKTSLVQNRTMHSEKFEVFEREGYKLVLQTANFTLYYAGGKFDAGSLFIDARSNYGTHYSRWYFGEKVKYNLKGTARTLDKADGEIPLESGIMSKDGFGVIDDSKSFILEGDTIENRTIAESDVYYFSYGRDYQKTLTTYYQLTGFPPMIPRFALGNWWSRYYPYHQDQYLKLMHKFDRYGVPISVSVLDMNWHTTNIPARYGSGWTGFSWDKDYFNAPQEMMTKLHAEGRKVTLNLHPAAGIRPSETSYPEVAQKMNLDTTKEENAIFDLQNPIFKECYFNLVLSHLEQQGVDFWWIDWQQGGQRGRNQIDPLWLLNIFQYQDIAKKKGEGALILSRYAGPGSHRYPVGFSGDTVASWKSLDFQPYFTANAANIGYTWWSHDIGGHMFGTYDGDLALRWLQFGVFSPILRMHSSNNIFMGKEPWNYEPDIMNTMIKYFRLRSKLIPYLFTENYLTHTKGTPLVSPIYYQYPEEEAAYQYKNEYFFGSQMLVAPITTPKDQVTQLSKSIAWLPTGKWYDLFNGLQYTGNHVVTLFRNKNEYPVLVKAGSILPMNPDYMQNADELPETVHLKIYAGADGEYEMVESKQSHLAKTQFVWDDSNAKLQVVVADEHHIISKKRNYTIEIIGAKYSQTEQAGLDNKIIISFLNYKVTNQNEIIDKELRQRLQFSQISFALKQEIWLNYQKNNRLDFINYLTSIPNSEVLGMLLELASLE